MGTALLMLLLASCEIKEDASATAAAAPATADSVAAASLYIDVHDLEPGKVSFEAVKEAHEKDLATQSKHGVNFIKYWVDEARGKVYCLSKAQDEASISRTHQEAHGLVPATIYQVSEGTEAALAGNKNFYLDVHELGAGKVSAKDVAGAHEKDLATQGRHGVNFINYWVDEKKGTVICLSEAADSNAVKHTHQEAHGLVPAFVLSVKEGR